MKSKLFSCHPKTPSLLTLIKKWEKSPYFHGILDEWIDINPTTLRPFNNGDDIVSFLPMEAVNDCDGGFELQEKIYSEVSTGYTRFADNDCICAKITPCMQNGKAAVVTGLISGVGFGSTEFHVLRPKNNEVLSDFLLFALTSPSYLDAAPATFSGTAGQQRLPESFLKNLPLPIPPIETQRELVAEMEQARESRRRKLQQANELLGSMDEIIQKKLELKIPKIENKTSYSIPIKQISSVRLDAHFYSPQYRNLVNSITKKDFLSLKEIVGFSNQQVNPETLDTEYFRYIEISGVDRVTGEVSTTDVSVKDAPSRARMQVKSGDIIISTTRPHHGSIALLDDEFDDCIASTGFAVVRDICDKVIPLYLLAILRCRICLMQMMQRSSGGNYPAITIQELGNIVIPIPEKKIQQAIVDELQTRRMQARRLREEAAREWEAAKQHFEEKLLGK